MKKNVRFAGGLNTWEEDTGNWGVRERGHEWGQSVGHTKAEWGLREEGDRKWGRMSVARELRTCETVDTGTQGSEREGY